MIYHKKDNWVVLKAEHPSTIQEPKFLIRRPQKISMPTFVMDDKSNFKYHIEEKYFDVAKTTVITQKKIIEINWD